MIPKLGLSEKQRQGVIEIMNVVLADQQVIYTKLRNYHWNIVGPQFFALHELFEKQYEQLQLAADKVAERIRAHGGRPIGTLKEFMEFTRLEEQPGVYPDATTMVRNLVQDHEAVVRNLREDADKCEEAYEDLATQDLLVEFMQDHEEMSWMLRSFVEGEEVHPSNGSKSSSKAPARKTA